MTQVEFGKLAEKNAVFMWIYCKETKPYEGYMGNEFNFTIPTVLAQFRWDGRFGAVGGSVDGNESLTTALEREVVEELGQYGMDMYEPLVSHHHMFPDGVTFGIHAYCHEVDQETMYMIQREGNFAKDFRPEVSGYCVLHCAEKLLPDIMKNNFVGTAKAEFKLLLEKINA